MKNLILILAIGSFLSSCSKDNDNCECNGEFANLETGALIHQTADCDRTAPAGYIFIKCMGEPSY